MPYTDEPGMNRPGAPPPPPLRNYGNTGVGPGQRPPNRPRPPPRGPAVSGAPPPVADEPKPLVGSASSPARTHNDVESDEGESDYNNIYEDEPRDNERRHKYSSANMERGNCRKYICIGILFLLFFGFSIGLSLLIKKVFFSEDDGSQATGEPENFEQPNATFQRDKAYVDTACSSSTFDQDGGTKCKEVCEPQYTECCRAFLPDNIYADEGDKNSNSQNRTSSAAGDEDGLDEILGGGSGNGPRTTDDTCTLSTENKGCQSYSKCIAAVGIDPAPAALPIYCSEPRLTEDRETCEDICSVHRCCFAQEERMHCRADKFDVCLDYAPCQNLRIGPILEVAPPDLDQHCFQQTPECDAYCKKAECCNLNHTNSCYETDFIACMTYSPCDYSPFTNTHIEIAPQFSVLPKLPNALDVACNERHNTFYQTEENPANCQELCQIAECCTDENPQRNCFKKDPLGCLAWDQQCQVNKFNQ